MNLFFFYAVDLLHALVLFQISIGIYIGFFPIEAVDFSMLTRTFQILEKYSSHEDVLKTTSL